MTGVVAVDEKLAEICRRYDELMASMSDPGVFDVPGRYQKIAKEVGSLEPLVKAWRRLQKEREQLEEARSMLGDPELGELARESLPELQEATEASLKEVRLLLLPKDPNDQKNVILEIRAGTGGEEASLFAADLFRMYARYAERKGWKLELLDESRSESGGYKEVIAMVSGAAIYSTLKFEVGVHRVQRVPVTESQGRIHTSACTVAVLPEAEEVELDIPEKDLRIDRFCASGPGGQCVNTTYSAIRITHIPTGIVVQCQDEKSQHKNKAKAMSVLRARILDMMEAEKHAERADQRRVMVGSGDRSERIRTYNFPQNRLTDHRIGLTLYRLNEVIDGDLDPVLEPARAWFQAELLKEEEANFG